MAQQLSSPGVSISVVDESVYTTAAAGTIPLIFVASASNKLNGSGTGIAPGTTATNDGKVYLLTSQKDLSDTFGTPVFKTDSNNNPIHAGEQNEYGLQAAYSYLGVSNRAYVARASVDLNQLTASSIIPLGDPVDGAFWVDTVSSHWGIFEWDSANATTATGQTFTNVVPTVVTDTTQINDFAGQDYTPKSSIGTVGSYAIVAVSSLIKLWYKKPATHTAAGTWVEVGTAAWAASRPTVVGVNAESTYTLNATTTIQNGAQDTITINGNAVAGFGSLASLVDAINSTSAITALGITAAAINTKLEIYSTGVDVDFTGSLAATTTKLGIVIAPYALYKAPALQISTHTNVPAFKRKDAPTTVNNIPSGSVWIKTTAINKGVDLIVSKYSGSAKSWLPVTAPLYANGASALNGLDSTGGGVNLAGNTVYVKYNDAEETPVAATFKFYRRSDVGATKVVSGDITTAIFTHQDYSFTLAESALGSNTLVSRTVSFTVHTNDTQYVIIQSILAAINGATSNVTAIPVGTTKIAIVHATGGDVEFIDGIGSPVSKLFNSATTTNFYQHANGVNGHYIASLWTEFTNDRMESFITPSDTQPTGGPVDGQLWYDAKIEEVDIMVNNGTTWVAYRNYDHGEGVGATDPLGPMLSPTKPLKQANGVTSLVEGDLWIDTSDTENYPQIYKYINFTKQWALIDKSDQTTEDGVLFADARWATNGISSDPSTIVELLGGPNLSSDARAAANFLDFDAPNPVLYPKGMLLWNLRRSGYNVKKYQKSYVNTLTRNTRYNNESMSSYAAARWVSEAANNEDGSGAFGRKSQRRVVIQSLQELVNKNQQVRETEARIFNLLAAPGYPELVGELKILNYDRGITAFVVADTPARLPADATSIANWGHNSALAVEDNDQGLVTSDPYIAFFYPWGYTSDNLGNNIVVPPSHMMLRTIALSDNVSYPWFAPAGTSRGVINNASSTGYVTSTGEFQTVSLNSGLRDTLAEIKVNPITYLDGVGLVNYAQYTRSSVASSLDRINVSRLVVQLRRQFEKLARPYLFEPNDDSTRKQIKHAAESLLVELLGQRAIYDYIVVCDKSNNTPDRIDRSELWLDVAIEPTKAVEFIYIPLRLKNTGEIKALGGV
jgi:Phage tail sheath C-terminal domain